MVNFLLYLGSGYAAKLYRMGSCDKLALQSDLGNNASKIDLENLVLVVVG